MPSRFRLFEKVGLTGDRFTLIDGADKTYISFNEQPWHPSYGIGIMDQASRATWAFWGSTYYRSLGRRIGLEDMEEGRLKEWVKGMVKEWGGDPDKSLLRGRNSLKARLERRKPAMEGESR